MGMRNYPHEKGLFVTHLVGLKHRIEPLEPQLRHGLKRPLLKLIP